ncbi:MAG: chemotaxis protein CheB [Proteobacteria bacterium]|nr:MAG: chemotaxis protein CheB [Pseudomonadota bacterium]
MSERVNDELLIVGIGASAGGLPAMIDLLSVASCHKSMCFVVVSHISRFAETDLPEILGKVSNLEAVVIHEGLKPQSCLLYTIPPNSYVTLSKQTFHVLPRPEGTPNNCADVFFDSLAKDAGQNAIGVILSGAKVGHDGAAGVQAIKKFRGHTFAQEPSTAIFKDMPEAAIATGCVDIVLPPPLIGHELSLLSWVASVEN